MKNGQIRQGSRIGPPFFALYSGSALSTLFCMYALSLKQPWATLLVNGLKTIEVRSWPTARRGPILIHAARVPDGRLQAWAKVPLDLLRQTKQRGGIIGSAELIGCVTYASQKAFGADQNLHLNEPGWFTGPKLFGFTFTNAKALPFYPFSGWMRFFEVDEKGTKHLRQQRKLGRIASPLLALRPDEDGRSLNADKRT